MTDPNDCEICNGTGLLKLLLNGRWLVTECGRCQGDGVSQKAKDELRRASCKAGTEEAR